MHSRFCYTKTLKSYDYDYSSDRAIWAISLVHYWCTHAFQVANCNGFSFNASPMGLEPNGSLYLSMILYDPRSETYVNNNASICLQQDIDIQSLCLLFPLCLLFNLIFTILMIAVFPHVFIIFNVLVLLHINSFIC